MSTFYAESHFGLNCRMAGFTVIVIALVLWADFLFLPPLLMKIEARREEALVS